MVPTMAASSCRKTAIYGGDTVNAYVRTYEDDGDLLAMEVSATQHRPTPGVVSLIAFNNVIVEMAGMTDDGTLRLRGTSKQAPEVRFHAKAFAYC
jgi:hypothetical protein